jgi:hypothetical protein
MSSENGSRMLAQSRGRAFDDDPDDRSSRSRIEAVSFDLKNQLLDTTRLFIGRRGGVHEPGRAAD